MVEAAVKLCNTYHMNADLKEIVKRIEKWSEQDQMELVQAALYIEQKHHADFMLDSDDWKIIDARKQAAEISGLAKESDVAGLFNKYRAA